MPLRAGWARRPGTVAFHDYPRQGHVSYAEPLATQAIAVIAVMWLDHVGVRSRSAYDSGPVESVHRRGDFATAVSQPGRHPPSTRDRSPGAHCVSCLCNRLRGDRPRGLQIDLVRVSSPVDSASVGRDPSSTGQTDGEPRRPMVGARSREQASAVSSARSCRASPAFATTCAHRERG